MKLKKLAIIYGILVWLVPFVVAFGDFVFHESNRPRGYDVFTSFGFSPYPTV